LDKRNLFLGLVKVDEVKQFKYLGMDFSWNLSWKTMRERVVKKANSRILMIPKAISDGIAPDLSIKLWNSLVRPILEFSTEVCERSLWDEAERVQLEMGKRILKVSRSTPSDVVRGELGWWSLKARRDFALLRWWGKIVRMDHSRLTYCVYRFRKANMGVKHSSWCGDVKALLQDLNLTEVWDTEEIGDLNGWSSRLKVLIGNREELEWKNRLLTTSKLRTFRLLKSEFKLEDYLMEVRDPRWRKALTCIRGGSHNLNIEAGRWLGLPVELRTCCVCVTGQIEDERHLMLDCLPYEKLRRRMFFEIRMRSGGRLDLSSARVDDRDNLMDVLIGHCVRDKLDRVSVRNAAAKFVFLALQLRPSILDDG